MTQGRIRPSLAEPLHNGYTLLLLGLTAVFVLIWQAPPHLTYQGLASYLPLHTALETFALIISFLVFGVVWNAYTRERASSLVILACIFCAVGFIDFLHILSFKGMPAFVTPSDPEKAINFWLAGRYLAAAGLLVVALHPWHPLARPWQRHIWLTGALAVVALVGWLGLYHQDALPHTFIEGRGLTPLKIAAEYLLVALFATAALLFYRHMRRGAPYDAVSLFNAAAISILSELSFTLYSDVTDVFNLLGHVYKVIAYAFIYRAVFVESVRAPFRQVQEAELRYRAVVEDMPVLICRFLPDGTLTFVNEAYCRYFGKTREELVGHNWVPLVPEEDQAYVRTQFGMLSRGKPTVTYEHRVIAPGDELRWQRWTDRAVFDGERLVEYQSIGEDITERKRAELALRQAEERYHSIFAGARDGIVLIDAETGLVADCNPEFERESGRPLAELKQFHIWDLRPTDKQEAAQRKFKEVRQAGHGGASDLELQKPDGTIVPIEFIATRIRIGERDYLQSIYRDITERRLTERVLATQRHELNERVKELRGLYAISHLTEHENLSLDEVFGRAVDLLPGAYQYPDIAQARIEFAGHDYASQGFKACTDCQTADIVVDGQPAGRVEVCYCESRPASFEGPFLKEERDFIDAVALRLGETVATHRARQALTESEEKFRRITATAQDAIILLDQEGRVVYWNPAAERIFGYSADEMPGRDAHTLLAPTRYHEDFHRGWAHFIASGEGPAIGKTLELSGLHKDGHEFPVELSVSALQIGGQWHAVGILRDITERKHDEEAIRASRDLLHSVIENIPIRVFWKDSELRYLGCNTLFAQDAGLARPEDLLGKDDFQLGWHDQAELYRADDQAVMDSDTPKLGFEEPQTTPDGHTLWLRTSKVPLHDADGKVFGVLGVYDDITEQRRIADALKRSEAGLVEAQRIAHLGSWELDFTNNQLTWSNEIYRIFEIDPEAFGASYEAFLAAIHPDDRATVDHAFTEHLQHRAPYDIAHRLLFGDGRIKYVHERCETIYDGDRAVRSLGTVQDITEQKLADLALQRLNHALRTLSAGNEVLVRAADETELLREMCRAIVENGGYRIAWVGYAEQDDAKAVRAMAQFGAGADYLDNLNITWDKNDSRGRGPTGTAIRTRRPALARDILADPAFAPWREDALKHGFAASIALPLLENEHCLGTLNIYAPETNAFDQAEVALLMELATDLAYGIVNLRIRGEQTQAGARLRESLVSTIRAIALTVEMRDPYTAGHQNKVADICVAIGKELGWSEDRLEGLRLGATIHDIGKINVPAEILNRPGRLSAPEFEIIKSHPQTGYEIVKDIAFPWPLAEMILQHHERLDGSGYPRGLKADAIIPEARILCVADVLDAMSSHRPYRAGLGKEAALAELERGRGTWYDPAAVDACLNLFRNNRSQTS